MRLPLGGVFAALLFCPVTMAQQWELGGSGGYGSYVNPTISGPAGQVQPAFVNRGVISVLFGENLYEHIGGEVRWLYQFGGPQLSGNGLVVGSTGYTNTVTYDVLFHTSNREANLRPFFAAGAGVKVFTGGQLRFVGQPLGTSAILASGTQIEPAISAGAGLKYRVARHVIIRLDFRTYFAPTPDRIFRPVGTAFIHGWNYEFVPLGGVSYVF
jgi:hypothetical protein